MTVVGFGCFGERLALLLLARIKIQDKEATMTFAAVSAIIQARKRNPNQNFWVRISSGGVGVFHVRGLGAKKFGMSFETHETQAFWRVILGFLAGYPENARNA